MIPTDVITWLATTLVAVALSVWLLLRNRRLRSEIVAHQHEESVAAFDLVSLPTTLAQFPDLTAKLDKLLAG